LARLIVLKIVIRATADGNRAVAGNPLSGKRRAARPCDRAAGKHP